jgi:hypothetical protein
VIRKLEQLINDKTRFIDDHKRRQTSLESEIRAIQEELEK